MMNTCDEICPNDPPYYNATITTGDTYHIIATTQCPPYPKGWNNPGDACVDEVTYMIPVTPRYAKVPIPVGVADTRFDDILYLKEDPAPILGSIGVLITGVNIFGVGSPCGFGSDCPNEGTGAPTIWVDAVESEGDTTDMCIGHPNDRGVYHIHSEVASGRDNCGLPLDVPGSHSPLLGYIFDGFGFYGPQSLGGEIPTDLDECGGHTHEIDGEVVYHYHLPDPPQYPWIIGCFKGCPEASNNPTELNQFNDDPTYGCPEGLTTDPDLHNGTDSDGDGDGDGEGDDDGALYITASALMVVFLVITVLIGL